MHGAFEARSKAAQPPGPREVSRQMISNLVAEEKVDAQESQVKKKQKVEVAEKEEAVEPCTRPAAEDQVWVRVQRLKRWALRLEVKHV